MFSWHFLIHFHNICTLSLKCCMNKEFLCILGSLVSNKGSLLDTNWRSNCEGSELLYKAYNRLTVFLRKTQVVSSIFWWKSWNLLPFFSAAPPPVAYNKEYASRNADSLSNNHNDSVFELLARLWIVSWSIAGRFSWSAPS